MNQLTRVCLFCALLLSNAYAEEGIKIGIITDLSGYGAFWGKQTQLGAEFLREDLKGQGIEVSYVFGDTGFLTMHAVSEAQKMMFADGVDALYAEFSSLVNAVSPVAKSGGKLLMAACGATSFLKDNPYAFKTFLDYQRGCADVARYWKSHEVKTAGILVVGAEIGDLCLAGAKSVFPAVLEARFNPKEDVASQVLKFKGAGVQAIFSSGFEVDNLNLLKNLRLLNYHVSIGGSDSDVLTQEVVRAYPAEIDGTVTYGYPEVGEVFRKRVLAKDPGNTFTAIEAAANAYIFLKQVVFAVKSCKRGDVACQVKAVEANREDPLLKFRGWRDHIAQHDFVLTVWKNGTRVPVNG